MAGGRLEFAVLLAVYSDFFERPIQCADAVNSAERWLHTTANWEIVEQDKSDDPLENEVAQIIVRLDLR